MVRRGEDKMDGRGTPFPHLLLFFSTCSGALHFQSPCACTSVCSRQEREGGGETGQENRLVNIPSSAKRGKKTSERVRAKIQ